MNQNMNKVHKITLTAMLVAIIFLLTFTPLGYLVVGPIAATTIQMPVIIGAALMGPVTGLVLGLFFGLSAIIKVLIMPGADAVATLVLTTAPLRYILICVGSRALMGWLTGLLGQGLHKIHALGGQKTVIRYGILGFVGSMLNTIFYLGFLGLIGNELVMNYYATDASGLVAMITGVAMTLGIPEAVVSCVIVGAVCKALEMVMRRQAA